MPRKAVTLVEVLVVLAILATLCGLLAPAIMAARDQQTTETQPESPYEPPKSFALHTERHDGHWWIRDAMTGGYFVHHPDCPCRGRQAEKEMR